MAPSEAHETPVAMQRPEGRRWWYARMLIDRHGSGEPSTCSQSRRANARHLLTQLTADRRKIGMPKHVQMGGEPVNGL